MNSYIIVGGSSGIGKSLANQLAESGNKVLATYNKTEPKPEHHPNLSYYPLDVLSESPDLSFLPDKIDGLVYCPGSIDLKPFHRIKPTEYVLDYQLQVVGAIQVIQRCLPLLKKSSQASIVLFSTVAVQTGFPFHSKIAASKGALEGLTRALAAELAPSIRVNCIAPSITDTPLASSLLQSEDKKKANAERHPLKSIGRPQDIAAMAAFLLSDQATWITGQIMHVDGGISTIKK